MRLSGCFLSVLLSVVVIGLFGRDSSGNNVIWLPNGLILAYLLIVPKWRRTRYVVAAFAGLTVGSVLIHETWRTNLLFNVLNIVEVGASALLLRKRSTDLPRFTEPGYLARFMIFGVFGGPFLAGILMAFWSMIAWRSAPIPVLLRWLGTDCVGIAVTAPVSVAIFQNSIRIAPKRPRQWLCVLALIGVTIAVFGQSNIPLLFIIFPFILLVQLELDLGWAALGTILVALLGASFTARGFGPLSGTFGVTQGIRPLILQLFIISAVVMMYSVSLVLEKQKTTERKLKETVSIYRLITDNSRDAIILADFDGRPYYVSPAVQDLWGWEPEELTKLRFLDLIHPEDRPRIAELLREMRSKSEGETVQYRARKKNSEYGWVETSLRTIHHPISNIPTGALQIVRDISERKHSEQKLEAAYHAAEALADQDALTGLANRRRLDDFLTNEWRRGLRDGAPLSFLLLDVDRFKAYNDSYGHLQGDICLKQIAQVTRKVLFRTSDLAARYGGEEFAFVLPFTPEEGARRIAEEMCAVLRHMRLPHAASSEGIVTVSVGHATLVPSVSGSAESLVELADQAMYQAKREGRNRICSAPSDSSPHSLPGAETGIIRDRS
jgi:diguanylate cyclase (GGDEF)-like protein/PAS domain S-box-containing protein